MGTAEKTGAVLGATASGERRMGWVDLVVCVVLALSVAAVYGQVAGFDFVSFDDNLHIRDNPKVAAGLTADGLRWAFTSVYAANWHPLTWISFMIDVELFGMNAGMHHLTSVAIHCINAVLLYLVLRRMTDSALPSAAAAALFALHPLHVESVAWISERKDVLSTMFWLLSMMAYAGYVRTRNAGRYLLTAFLFALGLMAKPMLVTLPFVLILLDVWPLGRLRPLHDLRAAGRLLLEKVPLMLMSMAASVVTLYAQWSSGAVSAMESLPLSLRIGNAVVSYTAYLHKTLWPVNLAAFYPHPEALSLMKVAAGLLVLGALTAAVLAAFRRRPYLAVGWFWYLGTLVPVIGIVQVGSQAMADRYTYIPLMGVFIAVAWGIHDLFGRRSRPRVAIGAATVAVAVVLAFLSWSQTGTWKDSETLFSHALRVTRGNYLAHSSLGLALFNRGDVDGAIVQYRESLSIKPESTTALCNLGAALARKKEYEEAYRVLDQCLLIRPDHADARYNRGFALSEQGRSDEAMSEYREAIRVRPDHFNALNNLGVLLARQGRFAEAVEYYDRAAAVNPRAVRARVNAAHALMELGETARAEASVMEAITLEPGNPDLHVELAVMMQRMGDEPGAVSSYRRALELAPGHPKAAYNLAVIHAGHGQYSDAMALMENLAMLRPHDPDVEYNLACLHSRAGNVDAAAIHLNKAVHKGFSDLNTMETDPDLDNLRRSSHYRDIRDSLLSGMIRS